MRRRNLIKKLGAGSIGLGSLISGQGSASASPIVSTPVGATWTMQDSKEDSHYVYGNHEEFKMSQHIAATYLGDDTDSEGRTLHYFDIAVINCAKSNITGTGDWVNALNKFDLNISGDSDTTPIVATKPSSAFIQGGPITSESKVTSEFDIQDHDLDDVQEVKKAAKKRDDGWLSWVALASELVDEFGWGSLASVARRINYGTLALSLLMAMSDTGYEGGQTYTWDMPWPEYADVGMAYYKGVGVHAEGPLYGVLEIKSELTTTALDIRSKSGLTVTFYK